MSYYNWQEATAADKVRFRKASPNLVALRDHVLKVAGGTSLGLFQKRPVRGGEAPSSHSFGAAWDWRYTNRKVATATMTWMAQNHKKLGVQLIVDYIGCRTWVVGRGWKKAEPNKHGMGQDWAKWIHVETTKEDWKNGTPIANR